MFYPFIGPTDNNKIKDIKLTCSSDSLISLLSNIDKKFLRLMYNSFCKILENNKLIHNLSFGFQNHFTFHELIHLIEKMIKDSSYY